MHPNRAARCRLTLALVALASAAGACAAAPAPDAGAAGPGKAVRSLLEIRRAGVVIQEWDLSCGAAALSTVLSYDYDDWTPEREIALSILEQTDPARVQRRGGFSLLDLKRFAESRGYRATGYRGLTIEDLTALEAPAIVPVRVKGYEHFVVVRGVRGDRVHLADPAFGNLTLRRDQFRRVWYDGIGFVVDRPAPEAPDPAPDPIPDTPGDAPTGEMRHEP
ncbi:MAG TPA: C39 family peptidase [Thermodesulfobacteriota bacterium]